MNNWAKTDFHIHATYHRLGNPREDMTVASIVRRCEALGYSSIGIVEHLDRSPKHPPSCLEELVEEFRGVASASLDLFVGAELDMAEGGVSVPGARDIKERLGLDYFLAAVHSVGPEINSAEAYIKEHHRKLMTLVRDCDFVDVIAHPWVAGHRLVRKGVIEEWRFEYVPEEMLRDFVWALADHGKAIEFNAKAQLDFSDSVYRRFVNMLRDAGVFISVGSDAHSMPSVGNTLSLDSFLQEMEVGPQQIWTPERITDNTDAH